MDAGLTVRYSFDWKVVGKFFINGQINIYIQNWLQLSFWERIAGEPEEVPQLNVL